MATTIQVEIETQLLAGLRERYPGKTDRELIERLAAIDLGMAMLRRTERWDADPDDVVMAEAVKAVREARAEME